MINYVLNYKFQNYEIASDFLKILTKKYQENHMEIRNNIPYFAFAARDLAGVEDNIKAMLDQIDINDSDYVALYYIREENPEKIKRLMLLGSASLAEDNLTVISSAEHENLLNDLFNIDFIKLRF